MMFVVQVAAAGEPELMNTAVWTEVVGPTAAAVVGTRLGGWLIAPLWQAG